MYSFQLDYSSTSLNDSMSESQNFSLEEKVFQLSLDKGQTYCVKNDTFSEELKNNEFSDNTTRYSVNKSIFFTDEDFDVFFEKNKETETDSEENSENYYLLRDEKKADKFKVVKKGNKGRKPLIIKNVNNKSKFHGKDRLDNLLSKIQVHFLSFLISLSNDALKTVYGDNTSLKFKKISYAIKKEVKFDFFNEIKKINIKNILSKFRISEKYKESNINYNTSILNKACKECKDKTWLNNFFNQGYLDIFKDYYYKNKEEPISEIEFMGKIIKLREAKSCFYLLRKNDSLKSKLIETIECIYLNNVNYLKEKTLFSTSKSGKE